MVLKLCGEKSLSKIISDLSQSEAVVNTLVSVLGRVAMRAPPYFLSASALLLLWMMTSRPQFE